MLWAAGGCIGLLMLALFSRARHPVLSFLGSAAAGGGTLLVIWLARGLLGWFLPVNGVSIFSAVFLGAPGVLALALLRQLML